MKTKIWITISLMGSIPLFITSMFNGMIAIGITFDGEQNFKHGFVLAIALIGMFSLSLIIVTLTNVLPKSDEIEDLQEAKKSYENALIELRVVREKYIESIERHDKITQTFINKQ